MKPEWVTVNTVLPLSRAVCAHPEHPRQRTALLRTALGPGRRPFLFKMRGMDVDGIPLEHRALQAPLYDLGVAFVRQMAKQGWRYVNQPLYAYGPYPAYRLGATAFRGPEVSGISDPDRQADAIVRAAGYVGDAVAYRLCGSFMASGAGVELPLLTFGQDSTPRPQAVAGAA